MITLQDFKQNLRQLARPNRFLVLYNPPSIYNQNLGNPYTSNYDDLTMHSKVAQIPGRIIGEYAMKYAGMNLKLPGDTEFQDLTISVLNTADWKIKAFFENWQNLFLNVKNNDRKLAIDAISDAQIQVQQIGLSEDDILRTYTFYNVYPKDVSSIELSMDTTDSVEEFTVTFGYSYWESD